MTLKKYSLNYGVLESAKIFEVERQTIKSWAYIFSAYLSSNANPGTGLTSCFTIADMRVFAYISMYWEESPDIEEIKMGLNSDSHFDCEPIDNFISQLVPLFQDMPDDIDESWPGIIFGGEFNFNDRFSMAHSFKLAGDRLVEIASEKSEEQELFLPTIFNYRHATELFLKAVLIDDRGHDLNDLFAKFKIALKRDFDRVPPDWFENIILGFHALDFKGTTFRYGDNLTVNELYADLGHVKRLMTWLSATFKQIERKRLI